MVMNFIRNNKFIAGLLAILRIYIGYKWITASMGKLTSGGFEAGAFIKMATESPTVPSWWATFLETVALPNQALFSFLVMWGELLVGIALILGIFTNFAAFMGVTMNLSFLFSGAGLLDAQMAILTVFLVIAGTNAGRIGLDRWVLPFLKNKMGARKIDNNEKERAFVA